MRNHTSAAAAAAKARYPTLPFQATVPVPRPRSISPSPASSQHPARPISLTSPLLLVLLSLSLFLFFLLVLLLALRLHDGRRDAVEVALAVLADPAAAVVRLLEHADLLERLADLALHARGRGRVVRGAVAAALRAAVQFCERADADVFAEVDVSRDGGCGCAMWGWVQR